MELKHLLDIGPTERYVTPTILATYLDMTANSITRLANDGLPKSERGRYPLYACIRWYLDRLEKRTIAHPSGLRDERRKLIHAQRIGQELANAKTRAELLDADLVATAMREMVDMISARLDELPTLAPEIARHRDPAAIARLVFNACREVRRLAAADVVAFAETLANGSDD
jgi:MoxR-like ATPase